MRQPQHRHLRAVEGDEDAERKTFEQYFRELLALDEKRREVAEDTRALLEAAKNDKWSTKTLREVLKISRMEPDERDLHFTRLVRCLEKVGIHLEIGFLEG